MEDSTFSLETRDRKMPHPLKSVYYVGDDGEEIDIQKGGVAGKVFGWIIFILILIPACYFGGRFLYRKHQTHRYAHPLSAPRDDTVIYSISRKRVDYKIFSKRLLSKNTLMTEHQLE